MCIVTKVACKERDHLCQMFDPPTDQACTFLNRQLVISTRSETKNMRKNDRPTWHVERITVGRYARMCHVCSLHDARKQCKCWAAALVDFCSNNSAAVLRVGFHPPNSHMKLLGHEMLVFLWFRTKYLIDAIWFSSCSRRRGPQVLWMSEYNFSKIFGSPTCMHVRWLLSLHLVYEWPVRFTMGVRTLWSFTSSFFLRISARSTCSVFMKARTCAASVMLILDDDRQGLPSWERGNVSTMPAPLGFKIQFRQYFFKRLIGYCDASGVLDDCDSFRSHEVVH